MQTGPALDRTTLEAFTVQARAALRDANLARSCDEWKTARRRAQVLCLARDAELSRLWKIENWGNWMTDIERRLASISGRL